MSAATNRRQAYAAPRAARVKVVDPWQHGALTAVNLERGSRLNLSTTLKARPDRGKETLKSPTTTRNTAVQTGILPFSLGCETCHLTLATTHSLALPNSRYERDQAIGICSGPGPIFTAAPRLRRRVDLRSRSLRLEKLRSWLWRGRTRKRRAIIGGIGSAGKNNTGTGAETGNSILPVLRRRRCRSFTSRRDIQP